MRHRRALVEVDFQGWVVRMGHRDAIPSAIAARRQARSLGDLVVCTRYLGPVPEGHGDETSNAFAPPLVPEPGDLVISKYGKDIFDNPDLRANIDLSGVSELVFTGLVTDHGVALAATSAAHAGYRTSVIEPACAGTSAQAHTQALRELAAENVAVLGDYAGYRWSA